jgi:hypothetical protein
MPQNNLYYDAAIEGYVAGSIKGRVLAAVNGTPPNPMAPPAIAAPADPSYAAIALEAERWAGFLDAAIPTDDTASPQPVGSIPTGVITTGVAIVPSTDATGNTQFAQLVKSRLVAIISYAVFSGRYDAQPAGDFDVDDGTPEPIDYTVKAASVAAIYQQLALQVTSASAANNLLLEWGTFLGGFASVLSGPSLAPIDSVTGPSIGFIGELGIKVDALIAFDATISISDVNGMPLAPTGAPSAPQQQELAKLRLMESVVLAYLENRNPVSLAAQNTGSGLDAFIVAWATANALPIANAYTGLLAGLDLSTTSAHDNPTLYNEAYCGFVSGALAARPFGFGPVSGDAPPAVLPSDDPSYAAIAAAAAAFALEVDTTVGGVDSTAHGTIPTGSGTQPITVTNAGTQGAVSPTTGALQTAQLGKTGLMWGLCRAVQWGRPLVGNVDDTTAATYTPVAQALVAAYLQLCTVLIPS